MRPAIALCACLALVAGCPAGPNKVVQRRDAIRAFNADAAAWRSTEGFQTTRWGMTAAEVVAALGPTAAHEDGKVVADMVVGGYEARVHCSFAGGRLSDVALWLPSLASARGSYADIKGLLSTKYGKPARERTTDTALDDLATMHALRSIGAGFNESAQLVSGLPPTTTSTAAAIRDEGANMRTALERDRLLNAPFQARAAWATGETVVTLVLSQERGAGADVLVKYRSAILWREASTQKKQEQARRAAEF